MSAVTQGHGELYYEATTIAIAGPMNLCLMSASRLQIFSFSRGCREMSSAAPPAGGRHRNVYGRPHPARIALDNIHRQFHTPREDSSSTLVDKRRNSRRRSVVLGEYTREGLLQLWELCVHNCDIASCTNSFDPSEQCWIWKSVKKRGKGGGHDLSVAPFSDELGYGVLQRGHGRAKIKVIQLAVWTKQEQLVPHGHNASHLCHNPGCIRPDHLVIETCGKNNRRVACPCWCFVPGTDHQQRMRICPHDPPCLRPDTKGMADKERMHDPSTTRGWQSVESKREVIDVEEDDQ